MKGRMVSDGHAVFRNLVQLPGKMGIFLARFAGSIRLFPSHGRRPEGPHWKMWRGVGISDDRWQGAEQTPRHNRENPMRREMLSDVAIGGGSGLGMGWSWRQRETSSDW